MAWQALKNMDWTDAAHWALARAQEPSTVAGICAAGATMGGYAMTPEYAQSIALFSGMFASLVCVLTKERKPALPPGTVTITPPADPQP
jgi:hypothetical protein